MNCFECEKPVTQEDRCPHRHGMHKTCCKKHSDDRMRMITQNCQGAAYSDIMIKEMYHAHYRN